MENDTKDKKFEPDTSHPEMIAVLGLAPKKLEIRGTRTQLYWNREAVLASEKHPDEIIQIDVLATGEAEDKNKHEEERE